MIALAQNKLVWLWLPFVGLIIQVIIEASLPREILAPLHSESGPHETMQFVFMVFACFASLGLLLMKQVRSNVYLFTWVFIAFIASVYIAGEEVSWGQHILNWESSEYWQAINDQGETNLHNTSSWFDQKPRLILEIGVLIGGLMIPLLRRFKPDALPKKFALIYPTYHVLPTALGVLLVKIIDKVDDQLKDMSLFERASEVQELYMYFFVLIYLVCLRAKLKGQDQQA